MVSINLDPSIQKVVAIGVFLFLESFIGALIIILQAGTLPTTLEWFTALLVALMVFITYMLTFLRLTE